MAEKKTKKKTGGLGTGLDSIFGTNVSEVIEKINSGDDGDAYGYKTVLNPSEIRANPYQPRKSFDQKSIDELAQSIKENGLLQPITVRKSIGGYELIAGERRLRALKQLGLNEVPAIVRDFNDQQIMEFALLENIQREDINVIEEANAYEKMMQSLGYTQEQLAERVGKSREHIANTLRLLKLPKDVQALVENKKLSMGHVRPLITLKAPEISEIAQKAVNEGLSVRAVEALANATKTTATKKPTTAKKTDPFVADVTKKLETKFSSKVKISNNSINILYDDVDDLNRILEILEVID